jgi:alpha-tubulin suppressor-like RCC1 family protein
VKCWGNNNSGQLGNGTNNSSTSPVDVVGVGGSGFLTGVTELQASAKRDVNCALLTSGQMRCWGSNGAWQLGSVAGGDSSTPVVVAADGSATPFTSVSNFAVGSYATCAIKTNGDTYCWGSAGHNELGSATVGSSQYPTPVSGVGGTGNLTDGVQISLGDAMACVVRQAGTVACWGLNNPGNGTSGGTAVPLAVSGVSTAIQVTADEQDACILLADHTVKCWGDYHGTTGSGATESYPTYTLVPAAFGGLTGVSKLSSGGWPQRFCAVLQTSEVRCWGANDQDQLGRPSSAVIYSNVPIAPQLTYTMGPTTTTSTSTTSTTTTTTTTTTPASTTTVSSPSTTSVGTTTTVSQGQLSVPTIPKTTTTTTTAVAGLKSTAVASTTTIPPTTTTSAPVAPDTSAKNFGALLNGKSVDAQLSRTDNQIVINAGKSSVNFAGLDAKGSVIGLDSSGNLRVDSNSKIRVTESGYAPNSHIAIWMFSTARQLGSGTTDAQGAYAGTFAMPAGLEIGHHRVMVTGTAVDGGELSVATGIQYGPAKRSSTMSRLIISIPIALAIAIGLLVPTTARRRRRKA